MWRDDMSIDDYLDWMESPDYAALDRARKEYFRLSERIRTSKDVYEKLAACEASYKVLLRFVQAELAEYGELPPKVLCRDVGPKLYMQLGEFKKARSAIRKCIKAGAYADDGVSELRYLARYETTAKIAIAFLREQSGYLQRNIYKALADTAADEDCLKAFIRSSRLIRKEKFGTTNKLFVVD